MSDTTEALRDIAANHGWPVCGEAADEIEGLEKAYELLFKENAELKAAPTAPAPEEDIQRLKEALRVETSLSKNQAKCLAKLNARCIELEAAIAAPAAGPQQGEAVALPTAFDYAAMRQMAVTKEWCRGWDDARAALTATGAAQGDGAKTDLHEALRVEQKLSEHLRKLNAKLLDKIAQQEAPAAQPLGEWRSEDETPLVEGYWYEVERADGTRCARAWGNDCWWIPLQDGWFSGIPAGFKWRGPLAPVEVAGDMSPAVECSEVERVHGIQPAATKGTT